MTQFDPSMVAEMLMSPIRRASENLGGGPMGIGADAGGSYFVDPEVAARTGYGTAVTGTSFFPGAGIVDAYGGAVDISGQPLPSFSENIGQGNYLDAALQGLGVAGDVATVAAPATLGASAVLGALLKAPRAAQKIGKATDIASDVSKVIETPKSIEQTLSQKYPDIDLSVFENQNGLTLSKIVVPENQRSEGIGTKVMDDLIDYADKNNLSIGVTPDATFGGSKTRLESFYKKFGFVRNKGRNKDFTFRETFVRQPSDVNVGSIAKVEPPTETKPGIIAFHGSGADFDEFNIKYIGTGEGAQAFGYGLYFTNNKDIGNFYKNALTRSVDIDGKPYIRGNSIRNTDLLDPDIADELGAANGDLELAIKDEEQYLQTLTGSQPSNTALDTASKETQKRIEKLKALRGKVKVNPTEGTAYKVGIQPKPEELIDIDIRLTEQPKILEKLKNYEKFSDGDDAPFARAVKKVLTGDRNPITGQQYSEPDAKGKTLSELFGNIEKTGNLTLGKKGAEYLQKLGIKGIKFKSGQLTPRKFISADEKQSENYVIFDDKLINILEKYGIVGPVAVSATAAALREDDGST